MIRTLPNPQELPKPPKHYREITSWATDFLNKLRQQLFEIRDVLNTGSQGAGSELASAPAITPTSYFHQVTGTAAIKTINVPLQASGPLSLKSIDGYTLEPGGNININAPTIVPRGTYTQLIYHSSTTPAQWHVQIGQQPPPLTADNFFYNEPMVFAGGAVWTIISPLVAGTQQVFRNGVMQSPGVEYSILGQAVTFNLGFVPDLSDVLRAFGRKP